MIEVGSFNSEWQLVGFGEKLDIWTLTEVCYKKGFFHNGKLHNKVDDFSFSVSDKGYEIRQGKFENDKLIIGDIL